MAPHGASCEVGPMVFAWQCYQGLVRVGAERDSHGVDHMQLSTRLWRPRQTDFVLSREEDFSGRDTSQAEWHQVQRAKFPSAPVRFGWPG